MSAPTRLRRLGRITLALLIALTPATAVAADEHTIGPGDLLRIVVWGHEDLSRDYPVMADGSMPFPLIGKLKADGMTTAQVAETLTTLLEQDYLVDPHVIVYVVENTASGNSKAARPSGLR